MLASSAWSSGRSASSRPSCDVRRGATAKPAPPRRQNCRCLRSAPRRPWPRRVGRERLVARERQRDNAIRHCALEDRGTRVALRLRSPSAPVWQTDRAVRVEGDLWTVYKKVWGHWRLHRRLRHCVGRHHSAELRARRARSRAGDSAGRIGMPNVVRPSPTAPAAPSSLRRLIRRTRASFTGVATPCCRPMREM